MQRKTYEQGDGHTKWGIYNTVKKEFQFGICEDSAKLAWKKLYQKIGDDARKWRFIEKPIFTK